MRVEPAKIIPNKMGPHFGNWNLVFGIRIRHQTFLGGNIPQGITEIHRNGTQARLFSQGQNGPWLKLPSNKDSADWGTIIQPITFGPTGSGLMTIQ